MSFPQKLKPKEWGALAALLVLCACTSNTSFLSSRTNGVGIAGNETATPVVLPITDELVKSQKDLRGRQVGQDSDVLKGTPTPYVIGPGDVLSIVVWGHPELVASTMATQAPIGNSVPTGNGYEPLQTGFVVDHDGLLQYPYAGIINLSGLTEVQARDLLASKLAVYLKKPLVTLRVMSYRSKRVYVAGEVKAPGLLTINDIPMTLVEALNRAGGVLPTGDLSQITVNRGGVTYQVSFARLMQTGGDPASILLMNGDVVRVLSRDESKVFVTGEVNVPKSITMHDGRLTLNEALGESGGINPLSGDARQIFVIRKSAGQSVVYKLDAQSPGALAIAESFELNPKDMIYVAPTGLADWHRTISLMIPGELSSAVNAERAP